MTRRDVGWALGLAAAALLCYVPALSVGFYSDDYEWLGRMQPTLENPGFVFRVFYRDFNPLLHVSLLLDWILGGGQPWLFHASSALWHATAAALVYLLCRRFIQLRTLAMAAAALWALNVRISEAVIWPAARGHVLASALALAGLLVATSNAPRRSAGALALFAAALLSKETALFAALALPVFLRDPRRDRRLLAAVAGLAVAFVAFNALAKESFHTSDDPWGFLVRKVGFLLLRPLGLGDLYDFSWPSFGLVLASLAGVAWALRREPAARAGLAWSLLGAIPLVPLDKLSSRYLYMMSAGYALVLCGLVHAAQRWLRTRSLCRAAGMAATGGVVLLLAANVVRIQREIEDYRILCEPYDRLAARFRASLAELRCGETLVLYDLSSHRTVHELTETLWARGTIVKLIPYREGAVEGLIHLTDLLHAVHPREPGCLAQRVDPRTVPAGVRLLAYDGRRVLPLGQALPADRIPAERISAVRWGTTPIGAQRRAPRPSGPTARAPVLMLRQAGERPGAARRPESWR